MKEQTEWQIDRKTIESAGGHWTEAVTHVGSPFEITRFFLYKNHVYKNVEAQICPFFKNIVVILLVVISISFEPQDKI